MSPQSEPIPASAPDSFINSCRDLRVAIKTCGTDVRAMHKHPGLDLLARELPQGADLNEAHANIELAFRHLEDAAMRLGKAIQAYDGGVSVYDK